MTTLSHKSPLNPQYTSSKSPLKRHIRSTSTPHYASPIRSPIDRNLDTLRKKRRTNPAPDSVLKKTEREQSSRSTSTPTRPSRLSFVLDDENANTPFEKRKERNKMSKGENEQSWKNRVWRRPERWTGGQESTLSELNTEDSSQDECLFEQYTTFNDDRPSDDPITKIGHRSHPVTLPGGTKNEDDMIEEENCPDQTDSAGFDSSSSTFDSLPVHFSPQHEHQTRWERAKHDEKERDTSDDGDDSEIDALLDTVITKLKTTLAQTVSSVVQRQQNHHLFHTHNEHPQPHFDPRETISEQLARLSLPSTHISRQLNQHLTHPPTQNILHPHQTPPQRDTFGEQHFQPIEKNDAAASYVPVQQQDQFSAFFTNTLTLSDWLHKTRAGRSYNERMVEMEGAESAEREKRTKMNKHESLDSLTSEEGRTTIQVGETAEEEQDEESEVDKEKQSVVVASESKKAGREEKRTERELMSLNTFDTSLDLSETVAESRTVSDGPRGEKKEEEDEEDGGDKHAPHSSEADSSDGTESDSEYSSVGTANTLLFSSLSFAESLQITSCSFSSSMNDSILLVKLRSDAIFVLFVSRAQSSLRKLHHRLVFSR
ncbi:hypothetical protein BLNAU_10139 [Blattamonas nauphoetae]|uniref:Uncharacterized protein n=1 Tax=Blattamonas nauphoetae TaxID=2049346 RepID=A0ABQ9XU36_9EUKA|nr:hypothetical protein BLNAU_10139 [Blattamonas nauphoetae]